MERRMSILIQTPDSFALQTALNAAAVGISGDMRVTMLFTGLAAARLKRGEMDVFRVPDAGDTLRDRLEQQMQEGSIPAPEKFLRKIKAAGELRVYVCSQAAHLHDMQADDLIPEVDGQMGLTAFLLEHAADATVQLTF